MLKRFKGIKPTHVWHLTPQKDFLAVIKDRLEAKENLEQRDNLDLLQITAIVVGSALAVFYSFGYFSPEKTFTTIIRTEPCEPSKHKQNKLPPCPDDCARSDKPCTKP